MRTLAKVLSSYHVELLIQNNVYPDFFLVHDNNERLVRLLNSKFRHSKVVFIKKETLGFNIISARKTNKKLYDSIRREMKTIGCNRLIIFTDNKPFDKFLIDLFINKNLPVELWEDGLGHYIGSATNKLYFKSIIKYIYGFYGVNIFHQRHRRGEIIVRDRFDKKNLIYEFNNTSHNTNAFNELLFIGQPLVEDGYIKEKLYVSKINELVSVFDLKVNYLPHPREDLSKYLEVSFNVIKTEKSAEFYCVNNEFKLYISAFSTTLLNINKFDKSYYIPDHFKLDKVSNLLKKLDFLPVIVLTNFTNGQHKT